MPLILSQTEMRQLLSLSECIDAIEEGFRFNAQNQDVIPVRLPLELPDLQAVTLFMPAYLPHSGTLGAKIVSVFPRNTVRGLPVVTGFYVLCDPDTGALLALMDATHLTAIRTAATSAVATRYLGKDNASRLAVFGAGVQARFHVEAMRAVRPITEIRVYNRTPERGQTFAEEIRRSSDLPVYVAESPDACIDGADLIVTCTRSRTPLFDGNRVPYGAHINAVGVYTPDAQELDQRTVQRAAVFVDTFQGALAEAGDLLVPLTKGLIARDHLRGELADLVTGQVKGRTSNDEITVFKSVGYALEDAVTAHLAYLKAVRLGVGVSVDL